MRGGLGARLKKDGMLKTTEFKTAEARLKDIPKARWSQLRISDDLWGECVDLRWRSVLEIAPLALLRPKCDHTKLLWGPELECDSDTGTLSYRANLCNGPW